MDFSLPNSASAGSMVTKMNITNPTSVLVGAPSASAPVGRTTPSPSSSASSNPPLPPASAPAVVPSLNSEVDPQIIEALRSKDRIYVLKLGEQFEGLIKEHRPERRICELVPAESNSQPSFKIMKRTPDRRNPHSHAGSIAGEDADLSDIEPSEAGSLGGQSSITSSSSKKRMTIEQREAAYNEARSRIFMGFEEKEKIKDKDMSASSSSLSVSGSTSTSAGGRSSAGDTDDLVSSPATESEWSTPSGAFVRDKRRGAGSGGASSSRSLRSGGSFRGDGSGSSSRNSRAASPSFSYASLYEPPPSGHAYDGSQHPVPPSIAYHHSPQYGYPYPSTNSGRDHSFVPAYPYYNNPSVSYQSPPPMQHNPLDSPSPSGLIPYSPPHQMNYGQPYGWPPLQSPQHPMHIAMPPSQHQQQPQHQLPQQNGGHPMGPMSPPSHLPPGPPTHTPPYSPYGIAPQHAYSYPMGQYYPPPPVLSPTGQPGQHSAPPQAMASPPLLHPGMHPHQMQHNPQAPANYDMARNMNLNSMMHMSPPDFNNNQPNQYGQHQVGSPGPRNGLGNGVLPAGNNSVNGRPMPARDGSNLNIANGGKRNVQQMPPPANTRSAWSYGPGVSLGGFPTGLAVGGAGAFGGGGTGGGNDSVGPRFNNSNNSTRRTSGHTNSGGNSRASSNCDDVSSIASSSTTSSSSRRTYTSTTSSQQQHPLPQRPDWAVGMKAQPTLASRHHDQHSLNNSRTMSPISPPRSGDQSLPSNSSGSSLSNADDLNSPRLPTSAGFATTSALQAVDFPPLTSSGPQEKRGPVATGAWGASRPILSPTLNGIATSPSIPPSPRTGAVDDGKGGEMYTPKLVRRTAPNMTNQQLHLPRSPTVNPSALVGQVASLSLADTDVSDITSATQSSSRAAATPATLA